MDRWNEEIIGFAVITLLTHAVHLLREFQSKTVSTLIAKTVHLLLPTNAYLVPCKRRLAIQNPLVIGRPCLLSIKHMHKSLDFVLVVLPRATVLAFLIARIGIGVLNPVQIQLLTIGKPAQSDLKRSNATNIIGNIFRPVGEASNASARDPVARDAC